MSTTKLKATHTATPWTFDGHGINAKGERIAKVSHDRFNDRERFDADSEFIVRAVNSHADMLEALEYISARIGLILESGKPLGDVGSMLTRWKAKADDAILMAKGEPR